MSDRPPGPGTVRSGFRADLELAIAGMDRRTVAYRETTAIVRLASDEVFRIAQETQGAVQDALSEARRERARADAAESRAKSAVEALELRQSGRTEPGHPVTIEMPRGANGRDWTIDELEETCFRFRVAGLVGSSRLELSTRAVSGWIPSDSEMPLSKAEARSIAEREAAVRAATRTKRIKALAVAVPAGMVAVPAAIAAVVLFKTVTTFLWGLL